MPGAEVRAGQGLQNLSQVNPSLWYMEGMAEYLTNGPNNSHTDAIMRDAANRPLAPARRKAELLRFARRAARRLSAQIDPSLGEAS